MTQRTAVRPPELEEARRREQQAADGHGFTPPDPPQPPAPPERWRPGWLSVGLAGAAGFLVGVTLLVILSHGAASVGEPQAKTRTRTVVLPPRTVITKTTVPAVLGEPVDIARERLERAGFVVQVTGGGVLGIIDEGNWTVSTQNPAGGTVLDPGATVSITAD